MNKETSTDIADLTFLASDAPSIQIEQGDESFREGEELEISIDLIPRIGVDDDAKHTAFSLLVKAQIPQILIDIDARAIFLGTPEEGIDSLRAWQAYRTRAAPVIREVLLRIQDSLMPLVAPGLVFVPPADVLDGILKDRIAHVTPTESQN